MYNHEPREYKCPICLANKGIENENTWINQNDIFYKDDLIIGFIGSKYVKNNPGHPILVPIKHYENIYELPNEVGARIFKISKQVAIALKKNKDCDGVSVMQFNEPGGGQHAFHYHLHVFPRFDDDDFYKNLNNTDILDSEIRSQYAEDLKKMMLDK